MTNFRDGSPENRLPIETNDDAVLHMLGGAIFGPNKRLTLPSGTELSSDEANAFTSAFADDTANEDPLSSRHDVWTGDPEVDRASLVARALGAIRRKNRP